MSSILVSVIQWTIDLVSKFGYLGIFLAMAIEAASIPLPSEIIMGIAGYLVYTGELNLFVAGFIGALGNATGSTIMYVIGSRGGRPMINKYGKYIHLTEDKFEKVDRWFKRYGEKSIFFFQLLPIVRTFVSLPLGILKVDFVRFRIYTFAGAFLWCSLLAYVSSLLGDQWKKITEYIHQFEGVLVVIVLITVLAYLSWRFILRKKSIKIIK